MVQTVIFSFDRAIQLELLLKSIVQNDAGRALDVAILYSFTSEEHEKSYALLRERYAHFNWVVEKRFPKKYVGPLFTSYWHNYYWWLRYKYSRSVTSDFRHQVIELLKNNPHDLVMFLTDDSMFFRQVTLPAHPMDEIRKKPQACSFSLRHGANITGGNFGRAGELLYWNRFDPQDHPEWSFPFSIDGHIYSKPLMLELFSTIWFKNPNTLEGNVACYVRERNLLPIIYANVESSLVGFELNRVQTISNNNNLNISSQYLNYLFNKGYEMDISFDSNTNMYFRPEKFVVNARKKGKSINIITLA